MKENRWVLAVFSPTGGTEKVARAIAEGTDWASRVIDLTADFDPALEENEVLLYAVPVYGGRVPAAATEAMAKFSGEGKKAVAVAVYGNREFEDALLEAVNTLKDRGFQAAAGAAFIAEHSIARTIAAARPDERDKKLAGEFGRKVIEKLARGGEMTVEVPGNFPYKPTAPGPRAILPMVSEACVKCGACARKCPVGAIPAEDPATTDAEKCIGCMRCVEVCPTKARSFPEPFIGKVTEMLSVAAAGHKEPQLFL